MKQGGSDKPRGHVDFKSAFYFQTPLWMAEAPMFLKNTIKVTDKYMPQIIGDKILLIYNKYNVNAVFLQY